MPSRIRNWDNDIESVPPCRVLVQNGKPVDGEVVVTQRPRHVDPMSKIHVTPKAEESYQTKEGPTRSREGNKRRRTGVLGRPSISGDDAIKMEDVWAIRQSGYTIPQVADKLKCSRYTVRNRIDQYRKRHPEAADIFAATKLQ